MHPQPCVLKVTHKLVGALKVLLFVWVFRSSLSLIHTKEWLDGILNLFFFALIVNDIYPQPGKRTSAKKADDSEDPVMAGIKEVSE